LRIAVFGGTGLVGSPAVERLQADGFGVRVISRDVARGLRQFGPSFDVLEADAESGLGLEAALQDCDGVFVSISGGAEDACVRNILQAARTVNKVRQVMYVSGCTVAPENAWFPMVEHKLSAERELQASGLPWTVLAPGWFFETLARFVRGGRAVLFGRDPNPYHFLAARDFAGLVSDSFRLEAAKGQRFVVHGPEAMTLHDALEAYCRYRHPEIREISSPPPVFLRLLARLKKNPRLAYALDLMGYFRTVGEMGDPAPTNQVFGAPATTLRQWLSAPDPE